MRLKQSFDTNLPKIEWTKVIPISPPLSASNKLLYLSQFRKNLKDRKKKYTKISHQQLLETWFKPVNQDKRLTKGLNPSLSAPKFLFKNR